MSPQDLGHVGPVYVSRHQTHVALKTLYGALQHVQGNDGDDAASRLVILDAIASVHGFPSYAEMIR